MAWAPVITVVVYPLAFSMALSCCASLSVPGRAGHWVRAGELAPLVVSDLDELALMHMAKTYPRREAERYLQQGFPSSMAGQVRGDAAELVDVTSENRLTKKLRYVGRATIRKRGCYGCHDIPGFERAQPIGPTLSDWGLIILTLLAFVVGTIILARQCRVA